MPNSRLQLPKRAHPAVHHAGSAAVVVCTCWPLLLLGMVAGCGDGTLDPNGLSVCDLESYTLPDMSGIVYDADLDARVLRITDVSVPNLTAPADSVELTVDPGIPIFFRSTDSTLVMRADTAFPAAGDTLNAWHTSAVSGTLPQYSVTRLELFRYTPTPAQTGPPCDLESYAIPDIVGEVYWVSDSLFDGELGVGIKNVFRPDGGIEGDQVLFSILPGVYRYSFVRASDSSLSLVDSLVPVAGETVQAWTLNIEFRTDPPRVPVSRIEVLLDRDGGR